MHLKNSAVQVLVPLYFGAEMMRCDLPSAVVVGGKDGT